MGNDPVVVLGIGLGVILPLMVAAFVLLSTFQ
jgi:hypothetical protein